MVLSGVGSHCLCLKSSNSGDTLKLMIPSYSRKAISGQINSLGTVTSQVMNESKMGYRGSKSVFMKQAKYMHRPLNYTVNYLLYEDKLRQMTANAE